jgi:hypothetical protein
MEICSESERCEISNLKLFEQNLKVASLTVASCLHSPFRSIVFRMSNVNERADLIAMFSALKEQFDREDSLGPMTPLPLSPPQRCNHVPPEAYGTSTPIASFPSVSEGHAVSPPQPPSEDAADSRSDTEQFSPHQSLATATKVSPPTCASTHANFPSVSACSLQTPSALDDAEDIDALVRDFFRNVILPEAGPDVPLFAGSLTKTRER